MKLAAIVGILSLSSLAWACPNLSGTYVIHHAGALERVTFVQSHCDLVTGSYEIKYHNGQILRGTVHERTDDIVRRAHSNTPYMYYMKSAHFTEKALVLESMSVTTSPYLDHSMSKTVFIPDAHKNLDITQTTYDRDGNLTYANKLRGMRQH